MIAGIGVDIVDVVRVQALLDRYGERFLRRVYTEAETSYAMGGQNRAERLAGRFAVKEAMMKALGTGRRRPEESGSPSSIFSHSTSVTRDSSSP